MLNIKKAIPHLFTSGNLLCGCLAIVKIFEGDYVWAAYLVGIACLCDFVDGFAARMLGVGGEFGKQLDSLADMVTFGVVPGVMMFALLRMVSQTEGLGVWGANRFYYDPICYSAFLIPVFSGLRLAKFNIDTRQSDSFIGVPTPANAILICSIPLMLKFYTNTLDFTFFDLGPKAPARSFPLLLQYMPVSLWLKTIFLNRYTLAGISIVMSFLLVAELPLFALKFKHFKWQGNQIRFIFLGLSLLLIVLFQFIALPLIIVLYVLLSLIHRLTSAKKAGSEVD